MDCHPDLLVDAGSMTSADLEIAAEKVTSLPPGNALHMRAHALAAEYFSLELGVARYLRLYRRLAEA
jgi:hypothetical protein